MTRLVAVIGGGTSTERDVSLATARSVAEQLPRDEFRALPVEILADGSWRVGRGRAEPPEIAVRRLRVRGVAAVFIGLHGRVGEDGTLQGFLDVVGLPYVGSGVAASAIAMDKARTREVLAAHGLRMPRALELSGLPVREAVARVVECIGLPAVVKDPCGGSSLEVSIAKTANALRRALAARLRGAEGRALVEEFVPGDELSCPVIGNASVGGTVEALPPILIRPLKSEFFDYRTKYDPALVAEICPAPVPEKIRRRVAEAAVTAHRALRCDGLSRSDFIVPADGIPRFLEVNTLPGMTSASLCPKAAAALGIPFAELLRRLLLLALEKSAAGGSR